MNFFLETYTTHIKLWLAKSRRATCITKSRISHQNASVIGKRTEGLEY